MTVEEKRFRQLCRESAGKALDYVLEVLETGSNAERLKAAGMVWDRAFGKPGNAPLTMPEAQRLDDATPEQRVAILAAALKKAKVEAEHAGALQ